MSLKSILADNPFLASGMMLMVAGWLSMQIRNIPQRAWTALRDRLLFTLEIDNVDPAFNWVKAWLSENSRSTHVAASAASTGSNVPGRSGEGRIMPAVHYSPRSVCIVRHRGRRVIAWTTKKEVQNTIDFRQTITLQSWFGNRAFFETLLADAFKTFARHDGKTIEVWIPAYAEWVLLDRKPIRTRDSVILPDGAWEAVVDDAKRFIQSREWYRSRCIPWRRGYLLYGPPGSGKSSLAHALASELNTDMNTLSLAAITSDDTLLGLASRVPTGNILLLEDIDAAGIRREGNAVGVSMSGLLNVLDGLAAKDGQIVVMTTNHLDKLDAAIVRPGRADVRAHIGAANANQAERMFLRFFNDPGRAKQFGQWGAGQSMATIQEHLLQCQNSVEEACRHNLSIAAA